MILQTLYELYDRLSRDAEYDIPPPGYSSQNIAFRVVLNDDGTLFDVQPLKDKKDRRRGVAMIVPGGDKQTGMITKKSVHKKVGLLRGTLPYILGLEPKGEDIVPAPMQFEAFKNYHLNLRGQIQDQEFEIVCKFLENWSPEKGLEARQAWAQFAGGQGVFQIRGRRHYVHDQPAVVSWYQSQHAKLSAVSELTAQCLVTGKTLPIARLHEPKIKGVKGAQSSGAPLVSFDKDSDAFASYGRDKQQGYNAPVSKYAAFRYATALNALTDGPMHWKHRFILGEATVVFWTGDPSTTEDVFAQFVASGVGVSPPPPAQEEKVRQKIELFLKALRQGREAYAELDDKADQTPFYILGLTGQARGRIGVRFFYTDRLSTLLDNLRRHYRDCQAPRWDGYPLASEKRYGKRRRWPAPEFPNFKYILDETCPWRNGKPDRDQIPPILEGPLLRAVITGAQYPTGLFSAVMRRIHADREVNYIRACVIAGYLRRNLKQEVSMSLDEEKMDPAYRLGRLFAVLEAAQLRALGDVKATIRDRFYSAASATPATVFPRLLRTYQHHLGKLEGGTKVFFERLAQEILAPVKGFPAHLNLPEQGQFALGYYHQAKELWTSKEDKAKEKGE